MKTITHFETPKRREILMLQRMRQEQLKAHKEKTKLRKTEKLQRQKRRQQFLASPALKLLSRMGSLLWAILVSLILTLIACYLAMNPHLFEALSAPVENFFSVNIAAAAPVREGEPSASGSGSKNISGNASSKGAAQKAKTVTVELEAEVVVEKMLNPSYLDKEDEVRKLLGTTRPYAAKGFSGTLLLTKLELKPRIGLLSQKVERKLEFEQLPSNDLAQLPMEQSFTLRSDTELGAQREVILRAAEWEWEIEDADAFGLPSQYKAFVTYRGEETWLDYTSVKAIAYYAATLSRELPTITLPLPEAAKVPAKPPSQVQTVRPELRAPVRRISPRQVSVFTGESAAEATSVAAGLTEPEAQVIERFVPLRSPVFEVPSAPNQHNPSLALLAGLSAATAATAATVAVVYYRRRKRQEAEEQSEYEGLS